MALQSLKGFSNSSAYKGSTSFSIPSSPFHGVSSGKNTLTMNQMLQLLHEKQQPAHRSFVGSLEHGVSAAAHPVLWALDKTMRPTYALASGADQLAQGHSFGSALHHAKLGIQGKEHTTYSKVLKDAGVLKGHRVLRGIAGFGLDVAADPTTYLTLGVGGVAKGAAEHAGLAALKDAGIAGTRKEAGRLTSVMAGHERILKDAGAAFEKRSSLAKISGGVYRKQAFGKALTLDDRQALNMARAAAQAEHDLHVTRKLTAGMRVPGTLGRKTLKVTTPLGVPRMAGIADKNIPLVSSFLGGVGDKFVPGFRHPIEHAIDMTRTHSAEHLAQTYLETIRTLFQGVPKMSKKRAHDLLHIFEKPGGVIKDAKTGEFILNPAKIAEAKAAGFTDHELMLAHSMHAAGQYLHSTHAQFGLDVGHLGEKGQLYVPHVFRGPDNPLQAKYRNMLTQRGFRKGRSNEFSLKEIADMQAAGHLPKEIETDPWKLMASHLRSVAGQHADQSMVNYVGHMLGTSARTVDETALKANLARQAKIWTGLRGHSEALLQHDVAKKEAITKAETEAGINYRNAVTRNKQTILGHLERDHTRTTMATVQRLSKYGTTLKAKHTAEIASIRAGEHPYVKEVQAARDATQQQMKSLTTELSKLRKEAGIPKGPRQAATGLYKGKATPGIGHLVPVNLKDKYGHQIHVPQEIANSVAKLERITTSPTEVQKFADSYRKYLGKWKIAVTSVNPGYGVRNTLSDFWNMYLSGVPTASAIHYGGVAAKMMRRAKQGDPQAMSQLLDAYHHGILSGLFQGDVQEMASMLTHAGSKKALASNRRFVALYAKITQDMNRNRENWGRLTHYLYRTKAQKMTTTEAAKLVRAAHFDYEELTPFERNVMKSIAPFYTWTRKNVPFQVKALLGSPGKFSTFPKLAIESQQAANPKGDQGIQPDYLRDNLAFQVPGTGGKFVNPMIGITDLNRLDPHQLRQTFASMVSPAVSVPYELAANKNLYTGQPISPDKHTRVPINDRYAGLLSLLPGSDVGLTQRNGTFGAGANPKLAFLLGQIPALQASINAGGKIKGKNQSEAARLLSYGTGVNLQKVDAAQQAGLATVQERAAFAKWEAGLKDSNPKLYAMLKSKRRTSANQKMLNDALTKALSGR
jgi:hypothetical protein